MAPPKNVPDFELHDSGALLGRGVLDKLLQVTVDEPLDGAAVATLRFRDPEGAFSSGTTLAVGHELRVGLGWVGGSVQEVFLGEVVAWKGSFAQVGKETLTVVALDRFHRLRRNRRRKTWLNMTDSDVVAAVAAQAGLSAECEASPVTHEALHQWNQTDADLVLERAGLLGWVAYVHQKKLHFHPPRLDAGPVARVKWHEDLHDFSCATSLHDQQQELKVTAWRMGGKAPLTATAKTERDLMGGSVPGKVAVAPVAPGPTWLATTPASSQGEVQAWAEGRFMARSERFVTGEGTCEGAPAVRRDTVVEVEGIGERLSGKYYVRAATHTLVMGEGSGYTTSFRVARTATG